MNASNALDKEQKLFYARLDDLEKRSRGGAIAHSAFLTPSEAYRAEKHFESKGNKDRICFFGGYIEATRKQIFLLPEYIADSAGTDNTAELYSMLSEDFDCAVCALKITGSGFRSLSHRDYLGSILALGIERASLGDICILDKSHAIVFCTAEVADLILYELSAIGSDSVKVEKIKPDVNMPSMQQFQAFSDTVASERLDCVVASLCNLAREKGQNLIRAGAVDLNYENTEKIDTKIAANDVISIRGYGKFVVRDISQTTKKGRLKLFADKYI